MLEECPTDEELCSQAPQDPVEAEAYFTSKMSQYHKDDKEAVAMCKYCIAKILMGGNITKGGGLVKDGNSSNIM